MAKTALVTGSSNGIGESIAKELAKLDYKLVVTGRDEKDIRRVAEACKALSPSGFKVSVRDQPRSAETKSNAIN